ncbi:hypothetical protein DFH06DRAFT_1010810 [Mycena polygramma]|nr:hypothetical protein DFH06DRAFT_1010810 [Mycena polygramma]
MGSDWTTVTELWWRLEEGTGFANQTQPLAPKNRPGAIGGWVKTARTSTPAITASGMDKDWWRWWRSMNPTWRMRDGELVQEGEGSWDELRSPGQNGFLNVIVCLKWWRLKLETPSDSWERAIADVKWVLEKMVG